MLLFQSNLLSSVAAISLTKRPYACISGVDEEQPMTDTGYNVYVESENMCVTILDKTKITMKRVLAFDYVHIDEGSPPCDTFGNSSSICSVEVASIIEAETRVQMLENHNHHFFHGKNPEIAHIKDKSVCSSKEAKDPNNRLHLSRYIHEHFDGINTVPSRTPSFIVRYISHDETLVDCPIFGNDSPHVISPRVKRQKVSVHIIFLDDSKREDLLGYFRNGGSWLPELSAYSLELYFENALAAKCYLQWKELKTKKMWEDLLS